MRRRSVSRDLDAPLGHLLLGVLAFALGAVFLWWSASAALAGDLTGVRPAHSRFAGGYGLPNWAGFVIGPLLWALAAMLAGDYAWARRGARVVPESLVVAPGEDGACEMAFLVKGEPCAGMAVEGALADAAARPGDWPDDPAATFSAALDGSGRASVSGMRPGETWRVRVLSGGSERAAWTVTVAPCGFDADGEVVFPKGAV